MIEKGFESKFAHDETLFKINAKRNKLLGSGLQISLIKLIKIKKIIFQK